MENLYGQTLLCLLVGYLAGNFLSAAVVAKANGVNIFEKGSGNPGMANTAKVLGKKMAALVLTGDILKTLAAVLLCRIVFPDLGQFSILVTGLGVTLGHDYPFWHKFQGGKGVASICATIILYNPWIGIPCCLLGLAAVLLHLGLKVGASLISAAFFLCMLYAGSWPEWIVSFLLMFFMILKNAPANRQPELEAQKKQQIEAQSQAAAPAQPMPSSLPESMSESMLEKAAAAEKAK